MAETLIIQGNTKGAFFASSGAERNNQINKDLLTKWEKYETLYGQLESLVQHESDMIANMANISACIKDTFHFWWVGFYRVINQELVLGPFQGPLACTRIRKGRGVCGTAWDRSLQLINNGNHAERGTIIVPDVEQFPGHIACSSASKSEIVVPLIKAGEVTGVLDIDSEFLNTFDDTDKIWLEKIANLL